MECSSTSCLTSAKWYWNNDTLGSTGARYDWDIYAHVFDQNGLSSGNEIPYKYSTTVSDWSKSGNEYWKHPEIIPRCTTMSLEENQKGHKNLYSGTSISSTSKACVANTHNAGNWYNFPAATAGSKMDSEISYPSDAENSICPKGWQLPSNSGTKSYQKLIRDIYQITDGPSGSMDINLLNNPAMSFVRLGLYDYVYGSLASRGRYGAYWSSTAYSSVGSRDLHFYYGGLLPQYGLNRSYGFSIRCVSR